MQKCSHIKTIYDFISIPDKFITKHEYPNAVIKEISIGDKNPILNFSEWNGNYWASKTLKKKINNK
jgi:hypothetical protein